MKISLKSISEIKFFASFYFLLLGKINFDEFSVRINQELYEQVHGVLSVNV